MKCEICGGESGKYPLCRSCYEKKEGHKAANAGSRQVSAAAEKGAGEPYLYNPKTRLISLSEQKYYDAIVKSLPEKHFVFPQVNLASFIEKTDGSRYQNELFRNVDFLVTDDGYRPVLIIEINDQTHLTAKRKERDEKVLAICEEAGIPIMKLWTSYGVNPEYIHNKIREMLASPVSRVHHFSRQEQSSAPQAEETAAGQTGSAPAKKKGCYIATCVYGSYDAPQVWVLRRYRDTVLSSTFLGNLFIRLYYSVSPKLVDLFGSCSWFHRVFRKPLDAFVRRLECRGFSRLPYSDQE